MVTSLEQFSLKKNGLAYREEKSEVVCFSTQEFLKGSPSNLFNQKNLQGNRFKQFFEKLLGGNFVQIRSNFPAKSLSI